MSEEAEAAEEDDDEIAEEEGAEGGGFGGKKLVLFIILPILLLGGAGAGIYFSGLLDSFLGVAPSEEAKVEEVNEAEVPGHYIDLDEMLVTLASKDRKQSFLKLRVSLELGDPQDEARVTTVMPRIIDNFQVFLRELRVEELQGSQGIYRVKEELLSRVNAAAHPAKVRDVLFREILVQ
ncbi:MAG: flagellar basal body protein FliL [Alphaproteobacteria bacterium]|nr:flagellar basal body protein FliL [Alphaproteobacteria bacterium]